MNSVEIGEPIQVLLVEDDEGDIELTREVMEDSKLKIKLEVAMDGVEAMALLNEMKRNSPSRLPDLILMDLNMPKKDGRETLNEIKCDPELKMIPVVVLTTSSAEEDIANSYTHGAACYVKKPVGFEEFAKVVDSVDRFWFTVVRYPSKG
ncbi:MAG: response regulator [Methanomassiliicoccales archaeon]